MLWHNGTMWPFLLCFCMTMAEPRPWEHEMPLAPVVAPCPIDARDTIPLLWGEHGGAARPSPCMRPPPAPPPPTSFDR